MKLVGGKEASRGFLYQGFASVLEALTDKNKWDKIYIEFPTSNDKVDIALGAANKVTIANILQITPPPKNSKHARCNFHRGSDGLKKLLDTMWNQGRYYLGEWHYHPNTSSLPSGIDNNQMIKLSRDKKLNCPEPILIIIGGYKDNWSINARLYVNSQEIIMNPK